MDALAQSSLWVAANVFVMLVYRVGTSFSWPTQTNEGPVTTGGDAFIWAFLALPVLGLYFIINFVWLFLIVKRRNWPNLVVFLLTAGAWLCLLTIEIIIRRQATLY